MIQTTTKQLELNLWQNLKAATLAPETADIKVLFQDLERVVAEVPKDQRLLLAGRRLTYLNLPSPLTPTIHQHRQISQNRAW